MEQNPKPITAGYAPTVRCAIYARYSSEQQRKTSIEDQIRNCRAAAERNGWVVLDEFIRSDEERTGRTLVGREGIADLIRLAMQRPKVFDAILIDDTSRLGRYLPDVLRECDRLIYYDVFIYFASDGLDTRDENSRLVHMVKGYGDERFVRDHGKKVHRGQEGRVLNGYIHGSRCYGYRNVPIPDGTRKGIYGQAAIIAVRQEIVPEQAEVVRRIMEMRASGLSFGRIARALKADGIEPPRNPNKSGIPAWYPSTIKEITKNELYRGVRIWNRVQNVFNFAEGKKSRRKRPPAEWTRVEVPELRIISDELWVNVQAVNQQGHDKYFATRQGGMNRTAASRTYLFSGIMVCAVCGGNFTVIGGKAPNVRYGCPNYRFRDTCTNKISILRTRLEQQLIAALSKNLMDERLEEERIREFCAQVKARIELEQRLTLEAASNGSQLKAERAELQLQAGHLVDAIAKHGISSFLSSQLSTLETRLAEIDRLLTAKPTPTLPSFSEDEIRDFLRKESTDFCQVLVSHPEVAKREIQKRIKKLVFTPKQTPNGTILEVSGDVGLFQSEDVMVNGLMDEIAQHYTRFCVILTGIIVDPSVATASL
jgi:site-specific DNA recombinase